MIAPRPRSVTIDSLLPTLESPSLTSKRKPRVSMIIMSGTLKVGKSKKAESARQGPDISEFLRLKLNGKSKRYDGHRKIIP